MIKRLSKILQLALVVVLIFGWIFSGWPPVWNNPRIPSKIKEAQAATFQMQTGYYVGNGASNSITGVGFAPEMVVLKSDTNAIATVFRTKNMPKGHTVYLGVATAVSTAGFITLDADGFTIISTANTANIRYTWIAFAGSDCTAAGTFCFGQYTGDGASPRTISTGFDPGLVLAKVATSTTDGGTWRTTSMGADEAQFFSATTQDAGGNYFSGIGSGGFTVGASNNANANAYYYVAFKSVDGVMNVGTYEGNITDNRDIDISDVGFVPDWVFLKNADAAVAGVHNVTESYGDYTSYFTNTANLADSIQTLQTDGFRIGANSTSNGSGNTIYYAAFAGASDTRNSSGHFQMANGSYTGTGGYLTIANLEFAPDLVIIKGDTTQNEVFRTSLMAGDSSATLGPNVANFTGGITSLNLDGFNVGTSATVNTSGTTYHWTAFGNAWNPETNSGASDFYIGAYYGNGVAFSRPITRLPYSVDMLTVKVSTAYYGVWRTSQMEGDLTAYFYARAEAADIIESLDANGFTVNTGGVGRNANYLATSYFYFGFKEGADYFDVGGYNGNDSDDRNITDPNFQPDLVWVKRSTAVDGVTRPSTLLGDSTHYFITTAAAANFIQALRTDGFQVGTDSTVNTSAAGTYRYAAWKKNSTQGSGAAPYKIQTGFYVGNGASNSITGVGFAPEMVVLKSDTNAIATVFRTKNMPKGHTVYLGVATAVSTAGFITLDADGFTIISTANTANIRYTWIAFAGSDCTAAGTFCFGQYIGDGASPRTISTGFDPGLVLAKVATSTTDGGTWRTTSMGADEAQFFSATTQDAGGNYFSGIGSGGFTVGASNNANANAYYYVAFKSVDGVMNVGTYEGNITDNRDIDISDVGFVPDWVFLKNADAAVAGVHNVTESYGDYTSYFTNTANLADSIQTLQTDGFRIGANSTSNGSGNTIYYAAFAGASDTRNSSGHFQMANGSYTGTGGYLTIANLEFAPDLVIIKGDTTQNEVFRTSLMAGDSSATLGPNVANFTGGITSLNLDGFNVGTSATVNTSGTTYHWTAFGNAWNPETNSGASDFYIGAYYGNGVAFSRPITRLPYSVDMLTVKVSTAYYGVWRTSQMAGDLTAYFYARAEAADIIESLDANGFTVNTGGVGRNANYLATSYFYFGFKEGADYFDVGGYNGNDSDDRNITDPNFQPDLVWVKRSTAVDGVTRPSTLLGDSTHYFITTAAAANFIQALRTDGFQVGTDSTVNTSAAGTYRYAAWKIPVAAVVSVTLDRETFDYGRVPSNTASSTFPLWGGAGITATNGAAIADLDIYGANTASWTLATATSTADIYAHRFCNQTDNSCATPWANYTPMTTGLTVLKNAVGIGGTVVFQLQMHTPNPSTIYTTQNAVVTVQASVPD